MTILRGPRGWYALSRVQFLEVAKVKLLQTAIVVALSLTACNRPQVADVQPSPPPAPAAPVETERPEEPWVGECGSLRIHRVSSVTPPVLVKEVKPEYPESVIEMRVEGIVLAELIVDAAGKVCDARIVSGVIPEVDEPILEAVRQWEFRPAELDGKAVAVSHVVPVELKAVEVRSLPNG